MEEPKRCPNCNGAGYIAGKEGNTLANKPCHICKEIGSIDQNSMAQANANYDRWKDARDVYKALSDFVMEKERTLPMHDADWIEFARYYAQRCGVVINEKQ
jgi:DnaJ-class molecular chaperone